MIDPADSFQKFPLFLNSELKNVIIRKFLSSSNYATKTKKKKILFQFSFFVKLVNYSTDRLENLISFKS